ncbi:hypothetical protein BDR03DRAFT_980331 [Suillus americanus]|nr:hypothetical protein BDR03DRAFT_980331 [Suillus americanus]
MRVIDIDLQICQASEREEWTSEEKRLLPGGETAECRGQYEPKGQLTRPKLKGVCTMKHRLCIRSFILMGGSVGRRFDDYPREKPIPTPEKKAILTAAVGWYVSGGVGPQIQDENVMDGQQEDAECAMGDSDDEEGL